MFVIIIIANGTRTQNLYVYNHNIITRGQQKWNTAKYIPSSAIIYGICASLEPWVWVVVYRRGGSSVAVSCSHWSLPWAADHGLTCTCTHNINDVMWHQRVRGLSSHDHSRTQEDQKIKSFLICKKWVPDSYHLWKGKYFWNIDDRRYFFLVYQGGEIPERGVKWSSEIQRKLGPYQPFAAGKKIIISTSTLNFVARGSKSVKLVP